MERKMTKFILYSFLMFSSGASASLLEVEEIIDSAADPLLHSIESSLDLALKKNHLDTMVPKKRMALLKRLHERSAQRAAERALSSQSLLSSHLYRGAFVGSLYFTAKYIVKILMPGRYGVVGQTFDSLRAAIASAALIYSSKKVVESFQHQKALRGAERKVAYFDKLIEKYQKNPHAHE